MTLKIPVRTLLLFVLCLGSCAKQTKSVVHQDNTVLRLLAPASEPASKTWIDASAQASVAPVYWSAGDCISVNGVASSPLEAEPGAKLATASFHLRNVTPPYTVIYPSGAQDGFASEDGIKIVIPATQEWKDGSFAEGSALMYGYSEDDAPVQMHHLCGAITFTLMNPDFVKVNVLSITSLTDGKPIAGSFILNPEKSLELVPSGAGSSRIDMVLPDEGLYITPEGTSFFFTIPAGEYKDGFVIRLDDGNKHILRAYWLRPSQGAQAGVTVEAGKLVVFQTQEYDPDAREICNAGDWEEFATAYNAGGDAWKAEWLTKEGTIRIAEDFTTDSPIRLENFEGILDGCGHTITTTAATVPLVNKLSGTIRNLTIAGTNDPADPSTNGATVFVTTLAGGSIINCTNKVNINIHDLDYPIIAGTFVRTFSGGLLENCVNEGNITLTCLINKNRYFLAGGLVALVKTLSSPGIIKGCVNKGKITALANKEEKAEFTPVQAGFGGIVGTIIDGKQENFLTIDSCVNQGDIQVDFIPSPTKDTKTVTAVSAAGGIVGTAMKYNSGALLFSWYSNSTTQATNQNGVFFKMKGCSSTGNVHNGLCSKIPHGDPNMDFAAGLIGIANGLQDAPAVIEDCSVSNAVIEAIPNTYYQRSGFCMVSAGLAGFAGYANFINCTVSSCRIGSLARQSYSVSGGIGMAFTTFRMEGCRIFADLLQIRSQISGVPCTEAHYSLGFTLSTKKGPEGGTTGKGGMRNALINPEGSVVTGCSFGGSITTNPTLVEYNKDLTTAVSTQKTTFDSNTFQDIIACGAFNEDFYNRNIPALIDISDNIYWNGQ